MRAIIGSTILLLGSNLAWSGPITSGGGKVYACFDDAGAIVSSEVLDLYEGRTTFEDDHVSGALNVDQFLDLATARLKTTGYNLYFGHIKNISDAIEQVKSRLKILPDGEEPSETNDSFEFIVPARGCRIAQAAFFADENNILISKKFWERFSSLDKAALILHEAVYWMDRQVKLRRDSRRARRVVSLSLAEHWTFEDIFAGLPPAYTLCNAVRDPSRTIPSTAFAVYRDQNGKRIQYLALNGDLLLSKAVSGPFDFPFLDVEAVRGIPYTGGVYVKSKFEDGTFLRTERIPEQAGGIGKFTVTITKNTYPRWTTEKTEMNCVNVRY